MLFKSFSTFILFVTFCKQSIFTNALIGNTRCATSHEFPAVVAIAGIDMEQPMQRFTFCTGTLITYTHVISSEHCFSDIGNSTFQVVVGSNDIRYGIPFFPWWWTTFDRWSYAMNRHIQYRDNDVSIIKVRGTVPNNITIALRSLISPQSLLHGLDAQIAGFGTGNDNEYPPILQVGIVEIIANDHCENIIVSVSNREISVHPRYMCSQAHPYIQLASGDSGGPLFYEGILIAINKGLCPSMNNNFHPGKVNIHMGIEFYREYIDAHLIY